MTVAYSYLRFSTPEQMKGDSHRRQSRLAADYALKQGLVLDTKLTFHDLGVSAFRGRNAEAGRLGDFLEAVKSGLVKRGSYLLVESLDRISRQAARKALRVLESIVDEGITVVTLTDGRAYDMDALNDDPMALIMALMIFIRSNEESATKARRLKSAWAGKRERAADKIMTGRAPAWLRLQEDRSAWKVVEDRAAVVRRVFEMAAAGRGQHAIAATLNGEAVPTFGDSTRAPGVQWHRSYVVRLLRNPAVVGTLVPHVQDYQEGKLVRTPQAPREGYYPAVVDQETFEAVQALTMDTRSPARGRHAAAPVQNIIGGMAACPLCSATMTRVSKGSKAKAGKPYLVCSKAKAGAGCTYRAVRLEDVENALRYQASYLCAHVPVPDESADVDVQLIRVRANVAGAEETLENLLTGLGRDPSPAIRDRIRDTEAALEQLRAEQDELAGKAAATFGPLLERRLEAVQSALEADPLDVGRANVALRQVMSRVVVDYRTGRLDLQWLHGGASSVMFAWPDETLPGD